MHPAATRFSIARLASTLLISSALLISGCAMTGSSGTNQTDGGFSGSFSMTGLVHGGQQPISGSTVTIYAAGNAGLGSTATAIATTTTDINGNFAFGPASSNTVFCPYSNSSTESEVLYIVSSGGDPTTGVPNTASVLMATLGDCRNLENTQPFVLVNELTTFASMTALQHFFNPTTESFGTTASNAIGLINAANTVNNLLGGTQTVSAPASADTSVTGATITITPETSKLTLAANVLAACVNTSGTGSTQCSTLFGDVNATPATDTLQAAYYMATNPTDTVSGTSNIATVYGLSSSTAPFQPAATTATDWTIGITYGTTSLGTGTGTPALMASPEYVALDPQGDVWVGNYASTTTASSIIELSPAGLPLKQALNGQFSKAAAMAIDPLGNVWVANGGAATLVEYTTAGAANSFTTSAAPYALAIDGQSNAYEISKSGATIQKVNAGATSGTSATTIATGLTTTYPALAFDTNYNLWLATGTTVDELTYSSAYATATAAGSIAGLTAPESIAVDPSGNIWAGNYGTSTGSLSELTSAGAAATGSPFTDATGLYDTKMLAIDSAGSIFTADSHSTTGQVVEFNNSGTLVSPTAGYAHSYYYSQSVAIDASGNVWVGNEAPSSGTPSITEIVGIAVPTITPIAANLPLYPGTPKTALVFSSLPNAVAIQGNSSPYTATVSSSNLYSPTGTFSLMYGTTTLCSTTVNAVPGGTITCTPSAITLAPDQYTVQAVYSGDQKYFPSSTPITLLVLPSTGSTITTGGISGTAQSGSGTSPLPIVGATVTLWATANNGIATAQTGGEIDASYYKGSATLLATTTTSATGTFTTPTFGCTTPDQLYITVAGGHTSGTVSNTNSLLLAALGPCATASALTPIIDEVTTVAAAYTLAPFISISGTNVSITASATNYATATQSTGTIYHPVGLQHAFLNAANLANVSTGLAQTALTGYSGTVVPVLPTALINSVANTFAACTQTQSNCTSILAAAIPLTTGTATAPTTTLQAALNIARNPYMGGAGKAATWLGLSSGATSSSLATPALTVTNAGATNALPHDLTAAIFYPASIEGNKYDNSSTLDANDNYYQLSETTSASPYYYEVIGTASNGTNLYAHQFCQSTTAYNQSTCAEYIGASQTAYTITADQAAHLWMSVNGTTTTPAVGSAFVSTQSDLVQLNASTGAWANVPANTATQVSTYIAPAYAGYALALDQSNNIWIGTSTATLKGPVYEYTSTNLTNDTEGSILGYCQSYSYDLQFDGQGNLFCSGYYSSTTYENYVEVIPNQSLASTTYPAAATGAYAQTYTAQSSTGSIDVGELYGGTTQSTYGIGLAFDSAGNVYQGAGTSTASPYAGDGLYVVTKNYTANAVTSLSISTSLINGVAPSTTNGLVNATMIRPEFLTQDGMGAIWVPDTYLDTIVRVYGPTGTSILALYPCVGTTTVAGGPTTGATCYTTGASYPNSTTTGFYGARQAWVDSTGTLYVMANSAATWAQVFGIATPDFPLAQAEHPAQMP